MENKGVKIIIMVFIIIFDFFIFDLKIIEGLLCVWMWYFFNELCRFNIVVIIIIFVNIGLLKFGFFLVFLMMLDCISFLVYLNLMFGDVMLVSLNFFMFFIF